MSSPSTPASSKTTGRMGASRRQSASLWSRRRGGRRVSRVADQVGSAPVRRSRAGNAPGRPPLAAAVARPVSRQRLGPQQLQGAGQRVAERLGLEPHPGPRALEQAAAPLDLLRQVVPPVARRLQLLLGDLPADLVEIGSLYSLLQPVGVVVADAAAQPPLDVVVDDLRQAAQLAIDGLGLAHQHLEHAVLDPLRQHEVVAAHLRRRLQLAVDAAVALLDAAGVPRQVEVEEVGAVGLEVQPLAGRVGGEQDA